MKRTWIYCYHNYTTTEILSPWKENRIQSPETMFSFSKSESIFRKWNRLFYFISGNRGFRPSLDPPLLIIENKIHAVKIPQYQYI